jgi:intracellular septation protein
MVLDLSPLLVFFLAYRAAGLLSATVALIACTLLSLAITYRLERRLALMPLASGVAVTILGGLTLLLKDDTYIKIKPTLVYLVFSALLLGGLYFRKPTLKYLLSDAMQINEEGWRKLSLRWGLFFMFLAGLNECIWRNFPTDFWVNFKVFGMFSLTMAFTLCQLPLIKKHWLPEEAETKTP